MTWDADTVRLSPSTRDVLLTAGTLSAMVALAWLGQESAYAGGWSVVGICLLSALLLAHRLRLALDWRRQISRLWRDIQALRVVDDRTVPETPVCRTLLECADSLRDVTRELRDERNQLADTATRDALTGLANRSLLVETITREVAGAQRTGWPVSCIIVDLDHFKTLNDSYGHQAGDSVLQRTSARLASLVRDSDLVARYGGEEFAIVLPRATLAKATTLAQELCNAVRCSIVNHGGRRIQITASFGVAELHECGAANAHDLVACADAAMYEAKAAGRDRVVAADTKPGSAACAPVVSEQPAAEPSARVELDRGFYDTDVMAVIGTTYSLLEAMPDLNRVANDTMEQVVATLGCERAALYLQRAGGQEPAAVASIGMLSRELAEIAAESHRLGAWFANMRGSDTASTTCSLDTITARARDDGTSVANVRVPLVAAGDVIGAVEAYDVPDGDDLGERERRLLAALSLVGGKAIAMCEEICDTELLWTSMIETVCSAMQAGRPFKRDHALKVSNLAVAIAREMGQSDVGELRLVRLAGLLGDIGAASIPKHIWDKRRNLSRRERDQVQEHTRIGARMIRKITQMDRLADIVLHHHEHFDGNGYPAGLAGDDIPIESRILSVADAYVAMTSVRPYRATLSSDDALQTLRDCGGTQFDPVIVDALGAHLAATPDEPEVDDDAGRTRVVRKASVAQAKQAQAVTGPAWTTREEWLEIIENNQLDRRSERRRTQPRIPVPPRQISLAFELAGRPVKELAGRPVKDNGTIVNISSGGIMFKRSRPIRDGLHVVLRVQLPEGLALLHGDIAHCTQTMGGYHIGVELMFDDGGGS